MTVGAVPELRPNGEPSLLATLLRDQQDVTAVDRFARWHEREARPSPAPSERRYRERLPTRAPGPGQQYAFEVDLDLCTACKACVTGCHSENGLDEGEVWRTVGLLVGGTAEAPAQQTVTTSCHHCLEPACMLGCPVKAYEKDPLTGVVRHLDDQCIGCQYCLFMCPYDAPKYNRARGIVRKCDMCEGRLSRGEAPACVQACPNEAIRIAVVDQAQIVEAAQAAAFVPGAPSPQGTLPATQYETRRARPKNLLPADFYVVNPEHSHPALVVMLVLTQLSVGAFLVDFVTRALYGGGAPRPPATANGLVALAFGLAALGASVFHLGRPAYFFRAVLGLATSWLSREIVAFSLFSACAAAYAVSFWVGSVSPQLRTALEAAVVASGLVGVACSVMVYAATRRVSWSGAQTGFRFVGSTLLLGTAAAVATSPFGAARPGVELRGFLAAVVLLKLGVELAQFRHLRSRRHGAEKRGAILLASELRRVTVVRFAAGALGGLLLPLLPPSAPVAVAILVLLLASELLERTLFFAAATAPRMPGGPT
jgi:Fe-S-cluster-containing dehydrogenase component/DMSO reductase anchor subunit